MRKLVAWLAEPVAVIGIVLALGWAAHFVLEPVRVAGGSMAPTLQPGDIVFVMLGSRPIPGDIALIRAPGHEQVLHRVVSLGDGGALRTRGDANPVADRDLVPAADVAGRCTAVLPVGRWLASWRGRPGYATIASHPNSMWR